MCIAITTYATLDLLLQHLDETYTTYMHLKCMKHTVTTCAHLLAAPQLRLVHAELDVGTELKVTHG